MYYFILSYVIIFSRAAEVALESRDEVIAKNKPEDVQWLSLLSDSELDLLISLKKLVIQRAKVVGHEGLAEKYVTVCTSGLGRPEGSMNPM
ncbi:Spc97/Spc98 [Macleaya cordata]|uniref:Spc97/Spc98 n=1 Tax=Macleaya cordata TaxID=56857 RepID=A0A200Q3V0_MACCD|nr:Spc97/Spc98 [Macleaya cordata]